MLTAEDYGVALFYDVDGVYFDRKSILLPFPPTYRFAIISDLENLIISGLSDEEIDDEMYETMRVRNFRLEYYRKTGTIVFAYYYEVEE